MSTTAPRAWVRALPNALTLAGAGLALLGCVAFSRGLPDLGGAAWLLAMGVDQVDGTVARSLGAASPVGARLDGFADTLLLALGPVMLATSDGVDIGLVGAVVHALAFAWRQARGDKDHLIGLPAVLGMAAALAPGVPVPGWAVLGWGLLSGVVLVSPLRVRGGPVYALAVAASVVALIACVARLIGVVG